MSMTIMHPVNMSYILRRQCLLLQVPVTVFDKYMLIGLNAEVMTEDGRWTISVFAGNITE